VGTGLLCLETIEKQGKKARSERKKEDSGTISPRKKKKKTITGAQRGVESLTKKCRYKYRSRGAADRKKHEEQKLLKKGQKTSMRGERKTVNKTSGSWPKEVDEIKRYKGLTLSIWEGEESFILAQAIRKQRKSK